MKPSSLGRYARLAFSLSCVKAVANAVKWFLVERVEPLRKLHMAEDAFVHPSVSFRCPENIFLGRDTRIQPQSCLWASPNARIVLGDFSGIGPHCLLFSSNHKYRFGEIYTRQPWVEADITIGKNVWVGAGCIITAGVTIGEGSVIGAGSVVNKDIPAYSLAVGVPAKVIKQA